MRHPLIIDPPLLNSANPWATTYEDLLALYRCPYTGAITTRTSLLEGFPHDDTIHKYAFFDPATHTTNNSSNTTSPRPGHTSSLNNLGYSPLVLDEYIGYIERISEAARRNDLLRKDKPIILSVTGTPSEVSECFSRISALQSRVSMPLAMEINLSCPNIPNKPPPAYAASALEPYLTSFPPNTLELPVPIGLKLPPYTYDDQFATLVSCLANATPCPVSFLTSTNTLGSSLLLSIPPFTPEDEPNRHSPTLSPSSNLSKYDSTSVPTGLGGLAGSALHPLALGNVYGLRRHLSQHSSLSHIEIIGVGGVEDADAFKRMQAVGASAVGVGTGLGRWGVGVFERIAEAWGDGKAEP